MLAKIRFFWILLLGLCICTSSFAQISGFVKDKNTTKVVTGAEVFINNSSIRTLTDKEGSFSLAGLEPGFVDLVVYRKGYDLFKSSIRIQENKEYKLNLDILPSTSIAKPAKVKIDERWNKNVQWFSRGLLGSGEFANTCKIINPKSLLFQREGEALIVSSEEPIKIENAALGFQLHVILLQFKAEAASSVFQVLVNYEVEQSDDYQRQSTLERNRLKAYWGSSRHLFQSLVSGTTAEEGFLLHDLDNNSLNPIDLIGEGKLAGYKKISLEKDIQVTFQMEATVTGIKSNEEPNQTSQIKQVDALNVNQKGILLNPQSVEISGSMAHEKLAYSLPIDYEPSASLKSEIVDWKNFSLLREKVYIHTDRDYYYPRETVWLKAYMGYSMPTLRDTLSQTLYVELLSPDKERIDSKVYQINEGVAWGDFKLDEKLEAGQYYLRAYTNWMLNYGDSALFVKPIPILKVDENVLNNIPQFISESSAVISIEANKESYKAREKVIVTMQLHDEAGNPAVGHISIAVTDAVASVPLGVNSIINPSALNVVSSEQAPNKYFDQITHYMERGISFRGVVKDTRNNPTPASLQVIQGNMDNLIEMQTDEQGEFLITGVKFIDSLIFAFKPFNKKGKLFLGRVDLLPREIPPFNFESKLLPLVLKKEDALQRIQNSYDPSEGVTVLKAVEVKSSKLAKTDLNEPVRIYGSPDYVVSGDNIRSTVAGSNFLVGLQGKVPGLRVIENADGEISVRVGRAGSFASSTEPLILVDGVPFPDARSISALSASMVDRVEVITRASPQYGSRGSNGVIAIYTKSGFSAQTPEPNYLTYKIPGYNRSRPFYSPDYSDANNLKNPDFRTTIFWKPDLKTNNQGKASVEFYSADLATRYRIVVQGVTDRGVPVRAVSYITVE
ncbi:MAG: carboxypeptidase regulatory-like domain-containing protein [Cyclobacteriaceae bacterium]|nr:carboxypeptidase regulatory-like domain-containing protein [Cyclobacteriaceae bacterium]